MSVAKNWHRFAALSVFVCAIALAGCAEKKNDAAKAEGDPKPAEPKEKKKAGDITMDDLRAAAKAAGGNFDKPTPEPKPPESLANVKADVVIPTRVWYEETRKDYNFVFNKYKGQVVEVSGLVADCHGSVVFVQGGPKETDTLMCPVSVKKPWTKVLPTQTVTLRARVVVPFQWEIVDAKGPPPPAVTADELGKDEVADKLNNQWAILTGVIAEVENLANGDVTVYLAAGKTEPLKCVFRELEGTIPPEQKKLLRDGQQVKFLGHYSLGSLFSCIVLEPAP
jgi:hypothetical protein